MTLPARPRVTIDCFPSSLDRYADGWAVVAVDVIRATTTAVTALSTGRRCFPVGSVEQARAQAALLGDAVLAGERDGVRPEGFEEQNSPAAFAARTDIHRPVVLLTTSGTQLLHSVLPGQPRYAACLRNLAATVADVAARHERVAVIGAGTRGEFREEDALCCAWIAEGLLEAGFVADARTHKLVRHWSGSALDAITRSKSAAYLERTGQLADLEFVLSHVDDVDSAFVVQDDELVAVSTPPALVPVGAA
jgi:2-phosphosulfolactate phosphatase